MKTVKVPLNYCLKNPDINLETINKYVLRINTIVIHALQFMKLYILYYYEKYNKLPDINKNFIVSCLKTVSKKDTNKGRPKTTNETIMKELESFYNQHYHPIAGEKKVPYTYLNTVLDYMTETILTCYENNIKQHFIEYLERYINVIYNKKESLKNKNKEEVKHFCKYLRNIKTDILNVKDSNFVSDDNFHAWIKKQKSLILPKKTFAKDSVHYDLQVSPFDYLPGMIFMMKEVEKTGQTMFNVFPLRNEIIPHHMTVDTTSLVHMLIEKGKTKYLGKGKLKKNEDKIWEFFFKTDLKCFNKKNYKFHHMIHTDGISCSIILSKENSNDENEEDETVEYSKRKEEYIDNLNDYSHLQGKNIVAIDPGKSDLIYCVDGTEKYKPNGEKTNVFRYTQNQRRKVSKSKKFRNIIKDKKKAEKYNEKTVTEIETELSKLNRKTLDFQKFKEYVKEKNKANVYLKKFYEQELFRKFKLSGFINTKRDEQNMINNFKAKFGNEKDVVICFGDFEQKNHMKFHEPTIGKGMRDLFRKNRFEVYLVNEFRTSIKCSKDDCGGQCERFLERPNPRPWKKDETKLVWGLLKCKTCKSVWNRDRNAASNIYKISENAINGKDRPEYLSRNHQLR